MNKKAQHIVRQFEQTGVFGSQNSFGSQISDLATIQNQNNMWTPNLSHDTVMYTASSALNK